MLKVISKSLTPVLKWSGVVATTAVVVMSIQVYADSSNNRAENKLELIDLVPAPPTQTQSTDNSTVNKVWSPANGFADLIEQVSPAVVHVAISGVEKKNQFGPTPEDFFEQFRGRQQQPEQPQKNRPLGIGSGFIISEDGFVVTNYHVIKDADEIVVTLTDGTEYQAKLKGSDSKTDLALLKLDNAKNLPFVAWGDDDKSRVGDWVLAIGNPFGLGGSASTGIISARGRDIRSGPYDDYIQVDAAINRGNSGGPLFNLQGQVIGINTAIYSPNGGSVGIGFSIPSNLAKNIIQQLRESGEVERAWIGVEIQRLTKELAEGFQRDNDHGALISNVVPNKPAANGGLIVGDIILNFDGEEIKKMRDLPRIVAQSEVGKSYQVIVWRNGARKTLSIKTDRYPESLVADSNNNSLDDNEISDDNILGAKLSALNTQLRQRFNFNENLQGVAIVEVGRNGLAAENGLRSGDVITSVDNVRVDKPNQITVLVTDAKEQNRNFILVFLHRGNWSGYVPFYIN